MLDTFDRVVVDFSAPAWCGPCNRLKPHFDAAAKESSVPFAVVDIDKASPDLVEKYQIMSVPTVLDITAESVRVIKSRTAPTILAEVSE